MPSVFHRELFAGADLGAGVAPDCCGAKMTASEATPRGYRDYTCGTCEVVLTVKPNGRVLDIEGA